MTRIKELTLGSGTITPHLKQETNDVAASARDAYVAFRKRTERMHTRRGQKTTETSFINMVKLQRDLKRCKDLLEMVKKREVLKKEVLAEQIAVIKQRFELKDWNGAILEKILPKPKPQPTPLRLLSGMPWNAGVPAGPPGSAAEMQRQKKLASKRKRDEQYGPNGQKYKKRAGSHSDGSGPAYMSSDSESDWEDETSAVTESEWEHDDPFRLRRRFNMYYHAPLGDCPVRTSRAGQYSLAKRAQELTPPSGNPGLRGFCRRRVGRGGRIFIDRCRPDYDFFNELTRLTPEQEADLAEQDKRLRDMRAQFEARRRQAHELKQQQQQRMLQQMQQRRMSLNSSTGIHAGGGGGAMLVPGTSPQPGDQAGRAQRTPHLPQSNPFGQPRALTSVRTTRCLRLFFACAISGKKEAAHRASHNDPTRANTLSILLKFKLFFGWRKREGAREREREKEEEESQRRNYSPIVACVRAIAYHVAPTNVDNRSPVLQTIGSSRFARCSKRARGGREHR